MRIDGTALERAWQRWTASGPRACYLGVLLATLAVYLLTAHWTVRQGTDALVAALPAHQLLTHGTLDLSGTYTAGQWPGIVPLNGKLVVSRTLGVMLAGLPGALLLSWTGASPLACGALSAALCSAAAVANVHLAMRHLLPPAGALLGAATLALGTGLWTIGSTELWTHGPGAFWLSCFLLALSRNRWWLAGLATMPALWTRPHLVVVAALVGVWLAVSLRRWTPLWAIGLPCLSGVAALVGWNAWYYGAPSLGGLYTYAVPHVTQSPADGGPLLALNVAGVLVSPMSGLLVFSPVVAVAGWALVATRTRSAPWVNAAGAASVAYLLVQMRISYSFTGGGAYYGNRYGIETLVLATPLLTLALARWARAGSWHRVVTLSAVTASCAVHAFGALVPRWWIGTGSASPWTTWYPLHVLREGGVQTAAGAVTCIAIAVLGVVLTLQDRQRALAPQRPPGDAAPLGLAA